MKTIKNILDLEIGDVVFAYGARFKVYAIRVHKEKEQDMIEQGLDKIMCAKAKWIDGNIEKGYFGPNQDWTFQGNANISVKVEV